MQNPPLSRSERAQCTAVATRLAASAMRRGGAPARAVIRAMYTRWTPALVPRARRGDASRSRTACASFERTRTGRGLLARARWRNGGRGCALRPTARFGLLRERRCGQLLTRRATATSRRPFRSERFLHGAFDDAIELAQLVLQRLVRLEHLAHVLAMLRSLCLLQGLGARQRLPQRLHLLLLIGHRSDRLLIPRTQLALAHVVRRSEAPKQRPVALGAPLIGGVHGGELAGREEALAHLRRVGG